jgi:beta-glucosidase
MSKTRGDQPAYRDPGRPVEERVDDLLARMTLEEKLAQLAGVWAHELLDDLAFSEEKAQPLIGQGIGQITRLAGASGLDPEASAGLANRIQAFLVQRTRLGIPAIVHEECCSGYMARGATCFPQMIGAASTWEPELLERMTSIIRAQMRAVGGHHGLAPVLDLTRDPRWGRVEETFGEDPYLISQMGVSYVRGLQGPDLQVGVVATGKHFVGYGLPDGGMNWAPAHLGRRELREMLLMPFEAAVKEAHLASIMNAYHELDGVPCGASRELLTQILREEWGFQGLVVSDYFAVRMLADYHQVAEGKAQAAAMALEAGIDLELPSGDCYLQPLRQALESGLLAEALVDQAVARVLRLKFALGLFEDPYVDARQAAALFDTPEQRALARQVAARSLVLLKNDGGLLPLRKDLSSIAVIGPNAADARNMLGDYSYASAAEFMAQTGQVSAPEGLAIDSGVPLISVLEGIRGRVSPATGVRYARGCGVSDGSREGFAEAIAAARGSEVAVLVMGGKSGLALDCTCGEFRDRADLDLPGVQEELVRAIYETGTPVVLVLIDGRPLSITWAADHLPAILEAWLPGEEGGAVVASVLFGDDNPGGKLPITFPRAVGQIPTSYNHKPSGGRSFLYGDYVSLSAAPLYPFGHGLSYTRFEHDNLRIDPQRVGPGDAVRISVDLKNSGERAGDEVVQLYIHDRLASVTRPVKELKGFKRVSLQPGEQKTVTFTLHMRQLAFYSRQMELVVEPGTIDILVGSSSADIRLSGAFDVVGQVTAVGPEKVFFSQVDVC